MRRMSFSLTKPQENTLRHMVGADYLAGGKYRYPKSRHGFRNRFCAGIGSTDYRELVEMELLGLVARSGTINEGRDQFFHVTRLGCEKLGMSGAGIERALEGVG